MIYASLDHRLIGKIIEWRTASYVFVCLSAGKENSVQECARTRTETKNGFSVGFTVAVKPDLGKNSAGGGKMRFSLFQLP